MLGVVAMRIARQLLAVFRLCRGGGTRDGSVESRKRPRIIARKLCNCVSRLQPCTILTVRESYQSKMADPADPEEEVPVTTRP